MLSSRKTVLVTGGAGFVGTNLVRYLLKRNFRVHVLLKKETNLWRLRDILRDINIYLLDLQNLKKLKNVCSKINPNYIFHLAAYGSYPSQTDIGEIVNTNILGTVNLLEATRDIPYQCFINTGSSSEYGFKDKPMQESDILEPISFYGVSKATSTLICQVFARQFKKPVITFRLFSVYGPYEEATRLIPTAIKAALTGGILNLTKGNVSRDFICVQDVISAYVKAMSKKYLTGEIFNIGSGVQHTNLEVAGVIKRCSKNRLRFKIGTYKRRPWDTSFWVANISKAKSELSWQPKYSLAEGLKRTYSWFEQNFKLYQK